MTDESTIGPTRGPSVPPASALDPRVDPDRWEGLVARINDEAAPLLEARRPRSVTQTLSHWRRPVALGSAGLVAAAAAVLVLMPRAAVDGPASLTETVMPWAVAGWVDGSYAPTVEELLIAVDAYTP